MSRSRRGGSFFDENGEVYGMGITSWSEADIARTRAREEELAREQLMASTGETLDEFMARRARMAAGEISRDSGIELMQKHRGYEPSQPLPPLTDEQIKAAQERDAEISRQQIESMGMTVDEFVSSRGLTAAESELFSAAADIESQSLMDVDTSLSYGN